MENLETPNNDQINGDNPFGATPEVSSGKNAMTYGLILAGISIVYTLILWLTGQMMNKALGYVSLLFSIGVMYYGTKEYRDKQLGGYMTYGKAFTSNFLIGLISSVAGTIFIFILYKFLDPQLLVTMKDTAIQAAMDKNPSLTEEQLDKTMSFVMSPVFFAISALFGGAIFSAILSLLVSIFHKKEQPFM